MPLHNVPRWYIGYFELWALEKQQMEGKAWPLLICLKTDPPKGTQLPLIPSLGASSTREDWLIPWGRRLGVDTTPRHTLSQPVIPSICSSKGPFIFPKNHLICPKKFTSHFPLSLIKWDLSLNSKPPLWVIHFAWVSPLPGITCITHVYMRYTC